MAAPNLIGVSATTRLDRGMVLRIGFAQDHTAIARASSFGDDMAVVWQRLHGVSNGAGYPITPNPAIRGETVSVVDFKLSRSVVLSELLQGIDTASGYWVKTSSVQLLAPSDAAKAPTNAGAEQREEVKAKVEKEEDDSNPLVRFARAVGTTLTVVKWLLVVIALVVVIYYGRQAVRVAKAAGAA